MLMKLWAMKGQATHSEKYNSALHQMLKNARNLSHTAIPIGELGIPSALPSIKR